MMLIVYIVFVSGLSSFVISLMMKWGIVEWVQVHGNDFFHKMFSCNFCLSFWTNLLVCISLSIYISDARVLFIPFFSTNITKHLI